VHYAANLEFDKEEVLLIRSTNQDLGEYDTICEPKHIAEVWATIENSLPKYWAKFVGTDHDQDPVAELAAKFGKALKTKAKPQSTILGEVFERAIATYEKDAEKYRRFFAPEALDEYRDDPNAFKQALAKDVPVIAGTLRQRRAELKEWQMHFRSARANDLLELFSSVLDFQADWAKEHPAKTYSELETQGDPEAFGLDRLDGDDSMSLRSVIGMGIKSIVLFHLDPERLPARGRNALYGLYFLSGRVDFGLPSNSSEFLMVNDINPTPDGSIIMDQNYWYPYGLFSLYALRIYKWLDQQASSVKFVMDHSARYIYIERFFEAVCKEHTDDLKTMRAHERFEVPG
jgi:hypothetical protein